MEKEIAKQQERFKQEQMNARAAVVAPKIIDEEARSIRTVLATETPSVVWDWGRGLIREILLISEKAINLPDSKQVPLLDSHSRWSIDELYGSMRNLRIENGELVSDTVFSSLAEDAWTKAREGHLTDVSVGYQTFAEKSLILAAGETGKVEGREFTNDNEDGMPLVIRYSWTPREGSLVVIGADEEAKFRSNNPIVEKSKENNDDKFNQFQRTIENKLNEQQKSIDNTLNKITFRGDNNMSDETKKAAADAVTAERLRVSEIEDFGKRFAGKFKDSANSTSNFIREGKSVDQFRNHVLDNLDGGAAAEIPKSEIGLTRKQTEEFSVRKAMLAAASGNWDKAEFEREAVNATAIAIGKTPSERGFFLPSEVNYRGSRALSTATSAGGGALVGVDYRPQDHIEMLRSKLVLGEAGMTILSGLTEDIAIPKTTGDPTISMVAEATLQSATAMTFGQLTASPYTATANVPFSRKLLIQSNPTVDNIVLNALQSQMNIKKDYIGLHGTGATVYPEGVAATSGVGTVTMATPSWAKIVEFESDVEAADATFNVPKWVMDAAVKGKLKTVLKATSTGIFLMDELNRMNGVDSLVSSVVAEEYLFYGYWSQLTLCEFGNDEIIVDPYTLATSGIITTTLQSEFDYIVRNPASFSVASDVGV